MREFAFAKVKLLLSVTVAKATVDGGDAAVRVLLLLGDVSTGAN